MTITIPKNPYKQPTEIRVNVVRGICNYFLEKEIWRETESYFFDTSTNKLYSALSKEKYIHKENILIPHESEMKEAFKVLLNAGYFMFELFENGFGYKYVCSEKDYYKDGYYRLWNMTNSFKARYD